MWRLEPVLLLFLLTEGILCRVQALSSSSSKPDRRQQIALSLSPGTSPWSPVVPTNAELLSSDPLVYTIPHFLSPEECHAYQTYVQQLAKTNEEGGERPMTRSNPPQVSLQVSKLWPLPFLSLLAGVPSILKEQQLNYHDSTMTTRIDDLMSAAGPPIGIALALSTGLVLAAQPVVQFLSERRSRRTSDALALNHIDDRDLITPMVRRIEEATGLSWKHWEAPVVTRYDVGAIFARHGDASPTPRGEEWSDQGGQRICTCICYLNDLGTAAAAMPENDDDGGGGGETYFDRLKFGVVPEQGKALFFVPADPQTLQADDRTTHESLPPIREEKWIVQLFGRVGPRVPSPLGLPDDFVD